MFRSIFKRTLTAAPGSQAESTVQRDTPVGVPVDETMVTLSRELAGIARMEVGQAAKERGWAKLQRELERHPVRPASVVVKDAGARIPARVGAGASGRGLYSGGRRWALGSAAAMVAVVAVLLGTYSAGLLTAGGDEPGGTVTSVVASDSTEPTTPTTQTPSTTGGPVTSESTPPTAQGPVTTAATDVAPPATETSVTTGGPITTGGPVTSESTPPTTQGPVTTQPPRTTTTGEQQVVAAQLEKTAKSAVFSLAAMVVDYFVTGDISGARALVAPGAQSSLVQMISSLSDPFGYRWISTKGVSADTVRITLEFSDRVSNPQGELVEVARRFALTVRVDEESAVITAISAGS